MERRQVTTKRCRLLKMPMRVEEVQLAGSERPLQITQEQSAEQPRQYPDGQEEAGSARNPALAVRRNSTTRHQAVQMRMVHQVLSPGVQHSQKADLRAQVFGIRGDRVQCFGRRSEQDVVDDNLVLEG